MGPENTFGFEPEDPEESFWDEKPRAWAAFDFSISCPALCLWRPQKLLRFENCEFFFVMKSPSQREIESWRSLPRNIHGRQNFSKSRNQTENFVNVAEHFVSILSAYDIFELAIEGYSMGSKGRVFDIAEATMALKVLLYRENIYENPSIYSPMTIKKNFCGKGNATKEEMLAEFTKFNELKGKEWVGGAVGSGGKVKSPYSDIVDSFALMFSLFITKDLD
jgi:hypothetical protein